MWKTPSWFQKIKAQNFQRIFAIGIFLFRGELLFHHYIECYIVSGSFWYNQVSYMVTNRDKKSFRSPRKNSKYCSGDWPRWRSWPAFRHLVNHFAESFRMPKSSKISSTIWSIITEVVTVSGRPGRGAKQMEKSQRLNWVTQISTVAYDGDCSPHVSVRIAWIFFCGLSCRKKNWRKLTSPRFINCARHLKSSFRLCNKKRLAIRHMNRQLFPTTLTISSYNHGK